MWCIGVKTLDNIAQSLTCATEPLGFWFFFSSEWNLQIPPLLTFLLPNSNLVNLESKVLGEKYGKEVGQEMFPIYSTVQVPSQPA